MPTLEFTINLVIGNNTDSSNEYDSSSGTTLQQVQVVY